MLVLTEDQRMLMESARGAVAASSPISAYRKLRAESSGEGFSRTFWRECAELGWTGVLAPETYGGIDFGVVGAGLIAREMARQLAPSPFLSTSVLAASALARFGSEALKTEWLARIARGMAIVGVSGDPATPTTKSSRKGEGWLLAGVQPLVLDGHVADAFLIEAREGGGEAALYLLRGRRRRRDAATRARWSTEGASRRCGWRVSPSSPARASGKAPTRARPCSTSAARSSPPRSAASPRRRSRARWAISRSASSSIAGSAVSRRCSIARRACMSTSRMRGRRASRRWRRSTRAPIRRSFDVAVAKAKASETACAATAECLQMHGGIGMTDEFDIGLYLKRARVDSVLFGDAAFHADRVASMLGY